MSIRFNVNWHFNSFYFHNVMYFRVKKDIQSRKLAFWTRMHTRLTLRRELDWQASWHKAESDILSDKQIRVELELKLEKLCVFWSLSCTAGTKYFPISIHVYFVL